MLNASGCVIDPKLAKKGLKTHPQSVESAQRFVEIGLEPAQVALLGKSSVFLWITQESDKRWLVLDYPHDTAGGGKWQWLLRG